MSTVTPIRRPAPVSNLRPISDPRITADAMAEAINAIDAERPAGLCETRWRILLCIAAHGEGAPSAAELRVASGLSAAALAEHVRGLRWRGLMLFESYRLSPSGRALCAQLGPQAI